MQKKKRYASSLAELIVAVSDGATALGKFLSVPAEVARYPGRPERVRVLLDDGETQVPVVCRRTGCSTFLHQ